MIVTCPNCEVDFVVSSEALGSSGRKVRCTKCKYIWFQNLPGETSLDTDNGLRPLQEVTAEEALPHEPAQQESVIAPEIPEQPSKKSIYANIALAVSFVLWLFTLSIVNSNKFIAIGKWYYSALGIYDDTGIVLHSISAEKIEEGTNKDLLVKGRIVNESEKEKIIPDVRITLIGEGREIVRTFTLDSHAASLAPGKSVDFENRVPELPGNVSAVIMDLGNKVNLASR